MDRDRGCVAHRMGFSTDTECWGRLVVHHKIIKGMGGTKIPERNFDSNLIVLCDRHHVMAHEKHRAAAEAAGIIIRRGSV